MAKFNGSTLTTVVAALLLVWLITSVRYIHPQGTDEMLSKMPSFGAGSGDDETNASTSTATAAEDDLRPLVLYTYAESDNARENLRFFIQNGLHGRADFMFIFNGETDAADLLPRLPNIRTVLRDNRCFDIGAFGEVLRRDGLWKKYKRFITMNASIRGPFAPTYFPSCWMDAFLGKITDKVKVSPHAARLAVCLQGRRRGRGRPGR